jgi:hypothetical protein
MGTGVHCRDTAAGRKLSLSLPPSDDIKNEWSRTSAPPLYVYMAWARKNTAISGFRLGVNELFALLRCYAAKISN